MRNKRSIVLILLMALFLSACGQQQASGTQPVIVVPVTEQPTAVETSPGLPTAEPTDPENLPETSNDGCASGALDAPAPDSRVNLGPAPGIPESTAPAERLIVVGTVFYRDCMPLSGVKLELWQTDGSGEYGPGHETDNVQCCYFQGTVQTDEKGMFEVTTVLPGHYKGEDNPPPAHIHVNVLLSQSTPEGRDFETEIAFTGDPFLPLQAGWPEFTVIKLEKIQDVEGETWMGMVEIIVNIGAPAKPAY